MMLNIEIPLISLIVPVFNVEKYLKRCLDSLISQSYKNIEIILIDDGSTDESGKICDRYAKEHSNIIKVLHQENQGLSMARNAGLDIAIGEYIGFVDSDDYVEPKMFERLYNNLLESNADISVCSFFEDNVDETNILRVELNDKIITNFDAVKNIADQYTGYAFVVMWNKLFKKKLFDKIRFPIGKIHEDQFIIHKLYYLSNKISTSSCCLYHHVNRSTNISKSSTTIKHFDDFDAVFERIEFCKENNLFFLYWNIEQHLVFLVKYYLNKWTEMGNLKTNEIQLIKKYLKKSKKFSKWCYQNGYISKKNYSSHKKIFKLKLIDIIKLKHLSKIKKSKHVKLYKNIYEKFLKRR